MSLSVTGLLIGSLAITVSQGILGSPPPDRLIADTLNSYAAPSKTSFTAYLVSVRKEKHNKKYFKKRTLELLSPLILQLVQLLIPVMGPF